MPPHERDKASVVASKHFCELLLVLQADGGCTHLAFTDGSKVGEEASKDGSTHVACGVFEGARLVCDDTRRNFDPNDVSGGEPHAFRAYGCGPDDAEVPEWRGDW